jgi:Fur family ferric uptake transcriptional regulator
VTSARKAGPVGESPLDIHRQIAMEFEPVFTQDGFGHAADRSKILEVLLGHEDHVSPEELTEELASAGAFLRRDFVEQVLDQFVHYGLAMPIRGENGKTRYEHVHVGRHHDHIICVNCGRIVEVECRLADRVAELSKRTGFHAIHTHLQIHGLCPECSAARPARFPLDQVAGGEVVRIVEVGGGAEMQQRLVSMGLRIGSVVRRQNSNWFGPVIVSVGTTRLALGRGVARRVIVEEGRPAPTDHHHGGPHR